MLRPYATLSRTLRASVAEVGRSMEFGKANPAAMSQTNPGNRLSGTRNSAFGVTD
jgi:hypothetical protein